MVVRNTAPQSFLAIDHGTSGTKSVLVHHDGQGQWRADSVARIPTSASDGLAIVPRLWKPVDVIRDVERCIGDACAAAHRMGRSLVGIGVTSTSSSLVCVDGNGHPVRTVPSLRWDDPNGITEARRLQSLRTRDDFPWLPDITAGSGPAKCLFLAKHHPDALAQTDVSPIEQWSYLQSWLTGRQTQSETIAVRKWGISRRHKWTPSFGNAFSAEIDAAFGHQPSDFLARRLMQGQYVAACQMIGPVRDGIVPASDPLPLVFGVPFDTVSQLTGLGLLRAGKQAVGVSLGTSIGLGCVIEEEENFSDWSPMGPLPDTPCPGYMMLYDGFASGGNAIERVCREAGLSDEAQLDPSIAQNAIAQTDPGANGIRILPFFYGGRLSRFAAPLSYQLATMAHVHPVELLVRATFESLAVLIRRAIEDFEEWIERHNNLHHFRFAEVRISGGLSKNRLFVNEILAPLLNRPLLVSDFADSGLMAVAACMADGLGLFRLKDLDQYLPIGLRRIAPEESLTRAYEGIYNDYIHWYRSIGAL